jgi:hypothetical protein
MDKDVVISLNVVRLPLAIDEATYLRASHHAIHEAHSEPYIALTCTATFLPAISSAIGCARLEFIGNKTRNNRS